MFIRQLKSDVKTGITEELFRVSKIEVTYYEPGNDGLFLVRSHEKMDDPNVVRHYKIFFGDESLDLESDSPLRDAVAELYKHSFQLPPS